MLTAKIFGDQDGNYDRYYAVAGLDAEALSHAENIFEAYRGKGVILNESFKDDVWVVTNQLRKTTLRFCPNEVSFQRYGKKWLRCGCHNFVDGVKAYVIFQMGSVGLSGIKAISNRLVSLVESPNDVLPADSHVIEFLKLLPGTETKDQVIEDLEERLLFSRKRDAKGKQRILSEFENYFRFNDAMESFWQDAGSKEKLFYFPLYLWWTLTAILPLRATEFLLTPRDCLEKKNGENILAVRRSALKGGQGKVRYNIDGDYMLMKYSIPGKMAAGIEWYREATADMPISDLGTLFLHSPHYSFFSRGAPAGSIYYTYQNLSTCLRRFQEDVMGIDSDEKRINLGDTRHLAMISLIVSGGSPVVCRELAGHEDVNISSHYYSNISRFVECATYEMHKKRHGRRNADILSRRSVATGASVEVGGGRCDSAAYVAGNISDCIRSMGENGELGQCICCPHFIDGERGRHFLFSDAGEKKKRVDDDSNYLMRVLEMARKGRGCNEDIRSALLKLQHSSSRYSRCLLENMEGM